MGHWAPCLAFSGEVRPLVTGWQGLESRLLPRDIGGGRATALLCCLAAGEVGEGLLSEVFYPARRPLSHPLAGESRLSLFFFFFGPHCHFRSSGFLSTYSHGSIRCREGPGDPPPCQSSRPGVSGPSAFFLPSRVFLRLPST